MVNLDNIFGIACSRCGVMNWSLEVATRAEVNGLGSTFGSCRLRVMSMSVRCFRDKFVVLAIHCAGSREQGDGQVALRKNNSRGRRGHELDRNEEVLLLSCHYGPTDNDLERQRHS